MRLEHIPILIGIVLGLAGLALIADAWIPDELFAGPERRRRSRAERHRGGEALLGLGALAMAAAFIGRDGWRYGTLAVIVGAACLLAGVWLNVDYLHEILTFRGPARRAQGRGGAGGPAEAERTLPHSEGLADRPEGPGMPPRRGDSGQSPAYRVDPTPTDPTPHPRLRVR